MEQLYSYFEGLLDKSGKTSTNSSIEAYAFDYIEQNIKTWSANLHMTYTISNKTVTFANGGVCSDDNLNELVHKYGIKKVVFQGNWDIYSRVDINDLKSYDLPVDIECDKELSIGLSHMTKGISTLENMQIKAKRVNIKGKVRLRKTQIQSDTTQIDNPVQITGCKIQSKQIILKLSKDKKVMELVGLTKVSSLIGRGLIRRVDWAERNPERIEVIKNIDPSVALRLDKYNMDNIAIKNIHNRESKEVLVFTKTPKSFTLKYPDIYEMKNGWYAIWLEDLKQFKV
nr:MAG TPA: hypothetical protein [Caudoviricetes sp.]